MPTSRRLLCRLNSHRSNYIQKKEVGYCSAVPPVFFHIYAAVFAKLHTFRFEQPTLLMPARRSLSHILKEFIIDAECKDEQYDCRQSVSQIAAHPVVHFQTMTRIDLFLVILPAPAVAPYTEKQVNQ